MLKWSGHVRGQVAGMREVEVRASMFLLCVCTSRRLGGGLEFRARGSCCFGRAARCVPFFSASCILMPAKIARVVSDRNRCSNETTHTGPYMQRRTFGPS